MEPESKTLEVLHRERNGRVRGRDMYTFVEAPEGLRLLLSGDTPISLNIGVAWGEPMLNFE